MAHPGTKNRPIFGNFNVPSEKIEKMNFFLSEMMTRSALSCFNICKLNKNLDRRLRNKQESVKECENLGCIGHERPD